MKVASLGCIESMILLLDHGADVSIQDLEGNTAAHYAAFDLRREAYLILVQHGKRER